jgi:hypothetical protein
VWDRRNKLSLRGAERRSNPPRDERTSARRALRDGEAENLIAAFLAARNITICPTRYAAPVEQRPLNDRGGN